MGATGVASRPPRSALLGRTPAALVREVPLPSDAQRRGPELVAHRGSPRERPENTLPAFRRALEHGADGIELDVHATADGVVVVHHDPVPRARAHEPGLRGVPIADLSWEQLRRFEVADGVGVPTLAEVLDLVGKRAVVYVEIKGRAIEREVVACIRAGTARCAVHSFDHAAVRRVGELAPELPRGLLFEEYPQDPAAALRGARARDLWPHWKLIDETLVAQTHAAGGRVVAWTVNDATAARRLAGMGVDALCTDVVPDVAAALR